MPNTFLLLVLVSTFVYLDNSALVATPENNFDYDSSISLFAKDMYTQEPITNDVKVYLVDEAMIDLGTLQLNNNELSTAPLEEYRFYFFMGDKPSEKYYVHIEDYKVPETGSVTEVHVEGCQIEHTLKSGVYYNNRPVTEEDPIDLSEEKELEIRLTVGSGKCYGMPQSEQDNIICFESNGHGITSSHDISPSGDGCYTFPHLSNGEMVAFRINAQKEDESSANIKMYVDDAAFDLGVKFFEEIYGYEDEFGNNLGSSRQYLGEIYG